MQGRAIPKGGKYGHYNLNSKTKSSFPPYYLKIGGSHRSRSKQGILPRRPLKFPWHNALDIRNTCSNKHYQACYQEHPALQTLLHLLSKTLVLGKTTSTTKLATCNLLASTVVQLRKYKLCTVLSIWRTQRAISDFCDRFHGFGGLFLYVNLTWFASDAL